MIRVVLGRPSAGHASASPAVVRGPSLANHQNQRYWPRDAEKTDEGAEKRIQYIKRLCTSEIRITFASCSCTHLVTILHFSANDVVGFKAV